MDEVAGNHGIEILLNGEPRKLSSENLSIHELLISLDLPVSRIAIELNQRVIQRNTWQTTTIQNGDRIEIVHFVGGG